MARSTQCCGQRRKTKRQEHPSHAPDLHRINRIAGQLEGVRKMIASRSYCPDILVQTKAIAAAVRSLEASILQRHLVHCVQETFATGADAERERKVRELVKVFRDW